DEALNELISHVGRRVEASELPRLMDFAFLALHGPGGEDGAIQGLLEWVGLPYSGSGVLPSALGIDKIAQKRLMQAAGLATPKFEVLSTENADVANASTLSTLGRYLGLPLVVKAPRQGSSIGVSIVRDGADVAAFGDAIDRALFRRAINRTDWEVLSEAEQLAWVRQLADIREGVGLPVRAELLVDFTIQEEIITHPEALFNFINQHLGENSRRGFKVEAFIVFTSFTGETQVLVEQFVAGREFSCIVVEDEHGQPLALPPTEIVKGTEVFDYRAKYLPGLARKITPIDLPEADIERIRQEAQRMFSTFGFEVYARLDGFIQEDGTIFLNDPNTTSGMLPASFFFHQAAEIGLNPSQFLTYIIRTS
ncbi:MAG: D-alanine--D-alanine ligase, partial [Hymenobacter sp.]